MLSCPADILDPQVHLMANLARTPKSLARMEHILATGKPLSNGSPVRPKITRCFRECQLEPLLGGLDSSLTDLTGSNRGFRAQSLRAWSKAWADSALAEVACWRRSLNLFCTVYSFASKVGYRLLLRSGCNGHVLMRCLWSADAFA